MADVKQARRPRSGSDQSNGSGGGSGGGSEFGEELQHLVSALGNRVLSGANDKVGGLTEKISGLGEGSGGKAIAKAGEKVAEGKSPMRAGLSAAGESVKSKVGDAFKKVTGGGKGGGGGKKLKVTNIIEQIDVGAPIKLVYDQWTQFQEFSNFMKKVEGVDQKDEQKLEFKAQILWSHRTWQATILEQVPEERIVWRSSGEKGHVDGAVTFHELAPDLTRVIVVLEYHPQGLFERTGNIWRAQGRRARLELKHFQRHVMAHALLHPDDVEGWRGEIHDSKVTKSDEDARAEAENDEGEDESEDQENDESGGDADDEYDDEDEDTDEDEGADEDEDSEDSDADDEYDDEAEDEDEDADEDADEEDSDAEDEYDDEADEDTDEDTDEDEDADEDEEDEQPDDEEDDDLEDEYDDEPEEDAEEEPAPRRRSRARARR